MKTTRNPGTVLGSIFMILFVFLFVFFLYTFLHEAGHVLAGWLFGQSLTEFDISFWDLSAHAGLAGGDLTQAQLAFRSAAGTLLPLLVWAIFISLVPRKCNFVMETLKLFSSLIVVNTLLAWIFIPVLFVLGKAPSDDVTNFLIYSGMPPLLLSLLGLMLYSGGWILFLSRIDGLRTELRMLSSPDVSVGNPGIRLTLVAMTGILLLCSFVTLEFNQSALQNSANRFSPPPDFVKVARIDLSSRPYESEALASFTMEQPGLAGVFITVRNIDTKYFDLSVVGPDGWKSVVLHGEGYSAAQDGGLWEKSLPPGTYELVLTSAQSAGIASVYVKPSKP
jgi:hypothetical protein